MPSIEFIAEKSGKIVDCKDKIEALRDKLKALCDTEDFSAKMELQIGRSRRSMTWEWLNKEEVKLILNRRVKEKEEELKLLEAEFEKSKS